MNAEPPIPKPMRLQEAAKFLGVSLKTATREKDAGKLEAFRIRGRWFTTMSFVHAYIDQQIQKAKTRKKPC